MSTKETKITHIFLKTAHGAPMEPVGHATAITGEGLQNDVSRGRTRRQVLIVDNQTIGIIHNRGQLRPGRRARLGRWDVPLL